MIRVGVLGAQGRMGKLLRALVEGEFSDRMKLSAAISSKDDPSPLLGCDVVIDFSAPGALDPLIRSIPKGASHLPAFVIGTTGWTPEQTASLRSLAQQTPVLASANFAIGVLALLKIIRENAPMLARLGYAPVLTETHHQHKKDAPSGTALAILKACQAAAPQMPVQIHSIRAGEVVGDHELEFFGPADRIVFRHSAMDRSIFARGALEAALWLTARRTDPTARGEILSMDAFLSARL